MKMNTTCFAVIASLFLLSSCSALRKKGVSCYDCMNKETTGHDSIYFKELVNRYTIQRFAPISEFLKLNTVDPRTIPQGGSVIKEYVSTTTKDDKASKAKSPSQAVMFSDTLDSRSVWFSLDSLKQFICTIERYNEGLIKKADTLGIRFYFAVYPDTHSKYPERHTLILVPTRRKTDFDPRYEFYEQVQTGISTSSPASMMRRMKDAVGKLFFKLAKETQLKALNKLTAVPDECAANTCMNDGGLCPPCSSKCKHGIGSIQ